MARPRSWSDDDLRTAVAASTTLSQVVRHLRLARGGAAHVTVRTRMEQLGLVLNAQGSGASDGVTDAATVVPGPDDPSLAAAIAAARSLNGVFSELGLTVGGSQWERLRRHVLASGCSTAHWNHPLEVRRAREPQLVRQLMELDLARLAQRYRTRAALLRSLGIRPDPTAYRALRRAVDEQGLPPSLLNGEQRAGRPPTPLEDILVAGSTWSNTTALRHRLIDEGVLEARCARCRRVRWQGGPIPLQLDHINGQRTDHRLENLRLLCANCHALTETWGARNRGRRSTPDGRP